MPTVLYWNIQNFSGGKMNTADVESVIFSTLYPDLLAPPAAEMFVIVEVSARNTALGAVPTNAGSVGMTLLLNNLQAFDPNWRCVPPISTADGGGRAEAIGVFYLNNVFTFIGPHVWSNFGPVPATQIGATVPPWSQITGVGVNAAQVAFPAIWSVGAFAGPTPPAPQIHFPNPTNTGFVEFPAPGCRRPLRCQFTYNAGGVVHGLDLWALHNPPQRTSARNATANLATLTDWAVVDPANSIRIVCGDFNLNTSNAWQYAAYGGMTALGFRPAIGNAANSFFPAGTNTHFADKPTATNYVNSGLSLDNMLTRGPVPLALNAFSVVDRVAGLPTPPWNSAMNSVLANIALMAQPGQSQTFRSWPNFGCIGNRRGTGNMAGRRGASDHMPLALTF